MKHTMDIILVHPRASSLQIKQMWHALGRNNLEVSMWNKIWAEWHLSWGKMRVWFLKSFVSLCPAGLAALLQCSYYVTSMSLCLSVCLSFCLHFCKTVTVHLCLCVSIHLSVCVCLSMSVFLPSCLPVNHIHSSFTMVLWQSLYNPGVLCLWSLSWMSTLCAVSLLSLMSTRMFLILIHSSLENIRLLNIA